MCTSPFLCSYYVGIQPCIAVMNLEMLRQILVKQFDNFMDREHMPSLVGKKRSKKGEGIFRTRQDDWKRQRRILSKAFSAVKLNKMSPIIEKSCISLVEKFGDYADSGQSFDLWKLYGLYTLEVILVTSFGHNVDVIGGQVDKLVEASLAIFAQARGFEVYSLLLVSNFPFLTGIFSKFVSMTKGAKNFLYLESKAKELIENRLLNLASECDDETSYPDLLQLLIDAKVDDDEEAMVAGQTRQPSNRKLTTTEIVKNVITFLLAGHETTNNALAYTSYLLALNPTAQEKLFKEIDQFYTHNPETTLHEAAQSLEYVDMVLQESLRIYPPAPIAGRQTLKDTELNGQKIPKNTIMVVPIMAIHHSPNIWPEPLLFKPERFSKEEKEKRHPMAHMPFGWGPRSCIGMRLALMEAKMALIALMKEYKFVEVPETEKPLKTSFGITMIPTNGIYLKVERR